MSWWLRLPSLTVVALAPSLVGEVPASLRVLSETIADTDLPHFFSVGWLQLEMCFLFLLWSQRWWGLRSGHADFPSLCG